MFNKTVELQCNLNVFIVVNLKETVQRLLLIVIMFRCLHHTPIFKVNRILQINIGIVSKFI